MKYFNQCDWNKESLINFVRNELSDSYIVFNGYGIVGVNVTTFEDCNRLAAGIFIKHCYSLIPNIWNLYVSRGSLLEVVIFFNFNLPKTSSKSAFIVNYEQIYCSYETDNNGNTIKFIRCVDKYHNTFYCYNKYTFKTFNHSVI